jgi:hypothetical protein
VRLADYARFRRIDETNIGDHSHLVPADECYFMFEYTSHKDYSYSTTNNLISNLKKKPGGSSIAELRYKADAIQQCGGHFSGAINHDNLRNWTIVPVPPSKHKADPAYDDRMVRICKLIASSHSLDIRELITQSQSTEAAHEAASGARLTVSDLVKLYVVDEGLAQPTPRAILIVDDVLTAGTHYRAMHTVLSTRFPGVQINGMFIARRIFPPDELVVAEGVCS